MPILTVDLTDRAYPIHIGEDLLSDSGSWERCGPRSLVVTSETVASLHLPALVQGLGTRDHHVVVLPDGEAAKTLAMVERVATAAIEAGIGRDGIFIALGGGAIGDITGFAAASFHRGIDFIQAPTTLLAQVDSSVGGKTAVNHPLGKNLIGAFHQPVAVVADTATLGTLPDREYLSGLAEVVKTGLLHGPLFERLETLMDALRRREAAALEEVILDCCAYKAEVVRRDETEQGERALLNLGHTFGHALESAYGGALLHGEAVALGCLIAARMSQSLGWLDAHDTARISALVERAGLPVSLPAPVPNPSDLAERMRRDKKVLDGVVRLVLLRGIGQAGITADYPQAALDLALREAVA